MKLQTLGKNTSKIEVQNIDRHGFWLFAKGKEYFLPYNNFPWFKDAKIINVLKVKLLHKFHLYWPALDIDLDLRTLENTSETPLVYH